MMFSENRFPPPPSRGRAFSASCSARHLDAAHLAEHNALVVAAPELARMLVRDLARERSCGWVRAGVHVADMTNAARAEPRHDQHAPIGLHRSARAIAILRQHHVPTQDRGERTRLAVGGFLDAPLDRALIDVVEAGERLRAREVVLLPRAVGDKHALIAGAEPHAQAGVPRTYPGTIALHIDAAYVLAVLCVEFGVGAFDYLAQGRGGDESEHQHCAADLSE